MEPKDSIVVFAKSIAAEVKGKNDTLEINKVIAERKAFLSKQKLTYQAKLRIDQGERSVYFFESLKESSAGMSSPGTTFQKTSYKVGLSGRQESEFEQQADFLGKKYDYNFDFKTIRTTIEELSNKAGFDFHYQITSKGI
jgi:hypothetical protein